MPHDTRESWHDTSIVELTAQLRTDVVSGLTSQEAAVRLHRTAPMHCGKAKPSHRLPSWWGSSGAS